MRLSSIAAAALCITPIQASAEQPTASVGEVAFSNSGALHAQQAFQRAFALLHNFEYQRAIAAFQEAQKADPGFVMAYWGEAMAYNHPIWMGQDAAKGRAVLVKLAPTRAGRLAKAATPRERGFLDALETLYGEGSKEERDFAYSRKMEALHGAFPQDVDVASFYALSLLGLAHNGRDYGLYMRAAAVLEPFFPQYNRHPGVLHYLIHSYDDPTHAPLGVRAARLYGAVAPDAGHALHMTSHIFLSLGDWQEVLDANLAAMGAVNQQRKAAGKGPGQCGHYLEWAYYSEYQLGRPARADAIRAACRAAAAEELASGKPPEGYGAVGSYADMVVRAAVETGARPDTALAINPAVYAGPSFALAYADLLSARSAAATAAAHKRLREIAATIKHSNPNGPEQIRQTIVLKQAAALEALRAGRHEEGITALRSAAELEAATPPVFGPPWVEKPSYELLGEAYLTLGRQADATAAFRTALNLAPRRKRSLSGLALAEKGQPDGARAATAAPHKH